MLFKVLHVIQLYLYLAFGTYMMLCLSIVNSTKLNLMSHKIEGVSICSDV